MVHLCRTVWSFCPNPRNQRRRERSGKGSTTSMKDSLGNSTRAPKKVPRRRLELRYDGKKYLWGQHGTSVRNIDPHILLPIVEPYLWATHPQRLAPAQRQRSLDLLDRYSLFLFAQTCACE